MHQKVTLVFFEIVFIFIILNSILEKKLSFDFFRFIKFHINCLNTIFIFNIGVCSFHQTNKEKSFDTDLFRV